MSSYAVRYLEVSEATSKPKHEDTEMSVLTNKHTITALCAALVISVLAGCSDKDDPIVAAGKAEDNSVVFPPFESYQSVLSLDSHPPSAVPSR